MTKTFDNMAPVLSTMRSRWAARAAYAACGWALLFAALSFFWAAGGRTGLHPLELEAALRDSVWMVINMGAGILKVIIGLVALALVQPWGQLFSRKLLQVSAWVLGVGMLLYGGLGLVSDVLHFTGIISDPANAKWFFWYLILWDPWWVLGGVLFVIVAWLTRRMPSGMQTPHQQSDASHT